jgi:KRAB domain-containing zinc finger protein
MSKSKYQQQFDEGRSLNWDDLLGWEKEVNEEEKLKAATEYKCGKCGKSYRLKIGLNLHIRTGSCDKTQEKLHSLCHQKNLAKVDDEDNFECGKCKKIFKWEGSLIIHLKIHHPEFNCRVCGKKFTHQSNLKRHLKVHSYGQQKFECQICGRKYNRKDNLTHHLKTHFQETLK